MREGRPLKTGKAGARGGVRDPVSGEPHEGIRHAQDPHRAVGCRSRRHGSTVCSAIKDGCHLRHVARYGVEFADSPPHHVVVADDVKRVQVRGTSYGSVEQRTYQSSRRSLPSVTSSHTGRVFREATGIGDYYRYTSTPHALVGAATRRCSTPDQSEGQASTDAYGMGFTYGPDCSEPMYSAYHSDQSGIDTPNRLSRSRWATSALRIASARTDFFANAVWPTSMRPGRRFVTSCKNHTLLSGSLNEAKED